ncbi:MAG TPA: TrmJ/YjtD family RNA methyltransferase, partial [Candidatus Angelobacter sp.]|nr:TrmJ/YjtD family RNA methyltransferase [Candidatus Angelobacter sp.]
MLSASELDNLKVVLVASRNPLNIGAAARAMSNFGFRHLRVVNPYDVAFREARSAVGAADLLARAEEHSSLAEAVADCNLVVGTTALQHRELQHPLHRLQDGAALARQQLAASRVAMVFGSEKRGLSNDDLSHCHWLMRIPTREQHSSMNLGQAVAICLYELARQQPDMTVGAAGKNQPLATAADLERITAVTLQSLKTSGYIKEGAEASTEEKLRRLVRRLNFTAEDAELWLG